MKPSRPLRIRLTVEALNDRIVPSTFGSPWPDAEHLTVSFAPDGTSTANGPSKLFSTLDAIAPTAVWQREILRGIQSWLPNAKINVGLVSDGGQNEGTTGAVQGDARFGDIRIFAAPLQSSVHAQAAPFHWTGTTLGGDITFNSNTLFRTSSSQTTGKELYSVALHEAGHVFGLGHSTTPGSVMHEGYQVAATPGAMDYSELESLYGPRVADAHDAASSDGNQTKAMATPFSGTLLNSQLATTAEITSNADVDYYRFTVPVLTILSPVSVRLKVGGISLLTSKITIMNAAGTVVGSTATTDPLANDLAMQFNPPILGGTYYVKVESNGSDFSVGTYKLAVDLGPLGGLAPLLNTVTGLLDGNTNDTLATALALPSLAGSQPKRFDYFYRGNIEHSNDRDYYRIQAPPAGTRFLNVLVWAHNGSALQPKVAVYNAGGQLLAYEVLSNQSGLMSIRVENVSANSFYTVAVAAKSSAAIGQYGLAADFNLQPAPDYLPGVRVGVSPGSPVSNVHTISEAGYFQFVLGASGPSMGSIRMTIRSSSGALILTLEAAANAPPVTISHYLTRGHYTVEFTTLGSQALTANLKTLILSDSVGTYRPQTTTLNDPQSTRKPSSNVAAGSTPKPQSPATYEF